MLTCPTCKSPLEEAACFCPRDGTAVAAAGRPDPLVGTVLGGQFRITGVLGRGAMGAVYRAWQLGAERPAAVKVLRRELARKRELALRFTREARAVASLSHPNIVGMYAAGETDAGIPYIAMELVDGHTLEYAAASGPLPTGDVVAIGRQIAGALAGAHAAGVIHRDLKPANVILARERGGPVAKILDFGIAKLTGEGVPLVPGESRLTRTGAVFGTPHYLSPEQARGDRVDARADVYGAGCTLFRLATGRAPFEGSGVAVMLAHMEQPPPRTRDLRPDLDPRLAAAIDRCLEKDPDRRFGSADELARALEVAAAPAEAARAIPAAPAAGEPEPCAPPAAGEPDPAATLAGPERARRRPRWLALALALIAAGVGVRALADGRPARVADPAFVRVARPAVPAPEPAPLRRAAVVADRGYSLRALIPEQVTAGRTYEIVVDAWGPDGTPLGDVALSAAFETPGGDDARAHLIPGDMPGRYRLRRAFRDPGRHALRVEPRPGAQLRIHFDVGGTRAPSS